MSDIDLSLILPCYNEEDILEKNVKQIFSIMDATKYTYEVIFVDDCSQDKTRLVIDDLVKQHPQRYLKKIYHSENTGRGFAVSNGIRQANGKVAGFIDIDLEVHAHYIPRLLLEIEKGYDVATGWRIYKLKWNSIIRYVATKTYNWLVKIFLGLPLKDTETGFKFFNRQKILGILEKIKDKHWFWDTEIMAYSYYGNLKIVEVPVLFLRREDKKSKVKLFHDSMAYIKNLWRFRKEMQKIRICE